MSKQDLRAEYKQIADFMDWVYYPLDTQSQGVTGWYKKPVEGLSHKNSSLDYIARKTLDLNFKYDWAMLMAVVNKIENTESQRHGGFEVIIKGSACTVRSRNIAKTHPYDRTSYVEGNKMAATYLAVVEFIDFYHRINLNKNGN